MRPAGRISLRIARFRTLCGIDLSQTSTQDEDEGHPGCALPPHHDDGVLAVPPEHGAEVQPPLLHALQHVPLLQLVHAIHLSAVHAHGCWVLLIHTMVMLSCLCRFTVASACQ